jgi:Tol biopolymer transport system component
MLAAISLALGGCGGGGGGAPTGISPPATPPPPIALGDPVDYQVLGSGRLCFERIVASGAGGGVFVIDAGARRAWGFANTADFVGGLFQEPAISPDGLRIAYSSYGSFSSNWDIFVMPADGGYPRSEAAGPGIESLPAWTPGSQLLWSDSESNPYLESYSREAVSLTGARVVSAYGGLQMRRGSSYVTLVSGGGEARLEAPAFSPDGTELAWVRVRLESWSPTSMDVVVADPDGGHPDTIATLPLPGALMACFGGNNLSLAWSPDGRRLAFNRPESSTTGHVFVVSRDGALLTQITSAPGVGDRSVSWSYLPRP